MDGTNNRISSLHIAAILLLLCGLIITAAGQSPQQTLAASAESSAHQAFMPIIMRAEPPEIPSIFGLQVYGSVPFSTPQFMPFLEDTQARWVRADIFWDSAEPQNVTPANYSWGGVDSVLSLARDEYGGYKMIATIRKAPAWAAENPNGVLYPSAYAELAEFMGAVVERYDGDGIDDAPGSPEVHHWEMYNEPDGGSSLAQPAWGDNGADYALMLQSVYPAIKSANPEAQVVFGGLAFDWFERQGGPFVESFLDDALAAGAASYFDVMNFHVYPSFSPNWAAQGAGLKEKAAAVRSVLSGHGVSKPLIVTEAGWFGDVQPIAWPTGPQVQAAYVVQFFVQSMAANLDTTIWWMLYDPSPDFPFGLISGDVSPVPRPSFSAYQTAVDVLLGANYVGMLPQSVTGVPEMEAYQFSKGNQEIYAAWLNPIDTTNAVTLKLQGARATLRTMVGNSSQILDGDDGVVDGMISVVVSATPVYVIIER